MTDLIEGTLWFVYFTVPMWLKVGIVLLLILNAVSKGVFRHS